MNKYLLFLLLGLLSFKINANCSGSKQHPCVVQDTQDNKLMLKNFRTSLMLYEAYSGNKHGLDNLNLSGSSANSKSDWQAIYKKIYAANTNIETIIDLDLRQEPHGYLNNNAINLTSKSDWFSFGKSYQDALTEEINWLKSLSNKKNIYNVLTSIQFKTNQFTKGVVIPVKSVLSEKEVVEKIGFHYERLTVTDHRKPNDSEVDRFLTLVNQLPANAWLHVHCRGGDGRTTTFMAMYDMLRNANKVSFEDIIKRQGSVEPFYDLAQVNKKHKEYTPFYQARYEFLKLFYQFSHDRLNGFNGNWSKWKKVTGHKI